MQSGLPPVPINARQRLSAAAAELLVEHINGLPVWIRAPKVGNDHYCGFSRSKLYDLAAKGYCRSVSIREPGQTKGTRLFHLGSILEFIERCEKAAQELGKNSQKIGGSNQ
jgi:hypothetical protein